MKVFDRLCRLVADTADVADWLVVYIEEAHPPDGWYQAHSRHQISQHRSMEDRLTAASLLARPSLPVNVVADTMTGDLNLAYGALPERLYILHDGLVTYQGGLGPFGFDLEEVDCWLQKFCDLQANRVDKNGCQSSRRR